MLGMEMKNKAMLILIAIAAMVSIINAEIISKNGVAKDSATGLMWQDNRDTVTVQKNWDDAKTYCENLTLGGFSDWRLPNIYELVTLVDNTKPEEPYVVDGVHNIISDGYLSSTTVASNLDSMWSVYFNHGNNGWNGKKFSYYVRCIRGKQLNFNNLSLLKKSGAIKVSQEKIDKISPKAEAEERKKETQRKSVVTRSYNSWTAGYKYNQSDSYAPFSYQTTEIICSNGTKGTVFDYYNRTGGDRFIINGNRAVNSFNEGADYICGNK